MNYLDLFFNDLPTREEGNSVDDIYAITKLPSSLVGKSLKNKSK